jgi:hypothetical protein
MSRRRRVAPVLAAAFAVAVVAVIAGFFVTRGEAGTAASPTVPASSSATGTSAAPTVGVIETDAAAPAANPSSGQTVATDEPVVVEGGDVPVELTSWGWNAAQGTAQVRGYAAGVVEDGGTCTLTLTKDGQQVTQGSEAMPDASTTTCGAVAVAGNRLGAGTWEAVLSYDSATSSGSSAAVEIEVPQ